MTGLISLAVIAIITEKICLGKILQKQTHEKVGVDNFGSTGIGKFLSCFNFFTNFRSLYEVKDYKSRNTVSTVAGIRY